ncbi:MAG: helix-hairpin-helix domain-containing protein [Pelosinus sp.]|nr:helix-hairpin-helix domain-containing protein [Pelosinus sp.]
MNIARSRVLVILVVAVIITIGSFYVYGEKTAVPDSVTVNKAPIEEPVPPRQTEDVVYVSGAVVKPGVVKLPIGSRVQDAVGAVGGITGDADTEKINLAGKVKDGAHVHVPSKFHNGQVVLSAERDGKININQADKDELDKLPGVGPAMAARIIEYREANGCFSAIEDLKKVKGMGEAKFKKLKDKITL